MSVISSDVFNTILLKLEEYASGLGLEFHPFKVSWYNNQVKEAFHLPYSPDTLVFCIVSLPSMFEKAFVPYILRIATEGCLDPLDQCMTYHLKNVVTDEDLVKYEIHVVHDYELHATRRPKLLVQTAGHVSGAAFFYQRRDVVNDPWSSEQQIFGVSVHPRYSGWFAFRGALIFKDSLVPFLEYKEPLDVLRENESMKINLLNKYNFHWQDWSFRDIPVPLESYSQLLKDYLSAKPGDRQHVIDLIKHSHVDMK